MNRLFSTMRWRNYRWILCAAVVPALWACNARKLADPSGRPSQVVQTKVLQSQNRKLDLIFMIDNSSSMEPLQNKLSIRLPDFIRGLQQIPGGLPDLHIAIISSSLGAGDFGDVSGCRPGSDPAGDQGGRFLYKANCGLNADAKFIKTSEDRSTNNFTGTIETVFSCLAQIGDDGCGFEHNFESTRQAIIKAYNNDADNGGFWRDDAFLGIVMLTNEDDCSVPANSQLFNTGVQSLSDQPPLGGLWSYRCNEFGHKCNQPLPHDATGLPTMPLTCESKENTDGLYHLTPVSEYVNFMKQVKSPEKLFVAVIGGPSTPYVVKARDATVPTGTEKQPEIAHSCVGGDGMGFADPGIRMQKFVTDLDGIFLSICESSFEPAMKQIADTLGKRLGVQCVNGKVTYLGDVPDCDVVLRTSTNTTQFTDKKLPFCDQGGVTSSTGVAPCWKLETDNGNCPNGRVLKLCYDAACGAPPMAANTTNALVSCALGL